jgi:hypothetical protein
MGATKMTFEDVKQKCLRNEYASPSIRDITKLFVHKDHIFDENKSVKWNREEVEKHNALVTEQKKKAMQLSAQMYQNYINDLIQAAYDEYDISEAQFRLIYEKVSEYTEYDYICAANAGDVEDYVDFISSVINAR